MLKGLSLLVREKRYVAAILIIGGLIYSSIIFALNIGFIQVVAESGAPFLRKLSLIGSLLSGSFSISPLLTIVSNLLISFLFALTVALTVFVFNRQLARVRGTSSLSIVGLLSALLGIGCASCGPLLVTSLLPFLGLGGLLQFLPFSGKEFELLGIVILLTAVYFLSKEASKPEIC